MTRARSWKNKKNDRAIYGYSDFVAFAETVFFALFLAHRNWCTALTIIRRLASTRSIISYLPYLRGMNRVRESQKRLPRGVTSYGVSAVKNRAFVLPSG